MGSLSDWIAAVALAVAILSAWFTIRESRKVRAERVEDRVREIILSGMRPLEYGVNAAELALDSDEPPTMFSNYESSGLKDLSPRLRRKNDRAAVLEISRSIDTVGAQWVDTIAAFQWWQEAATPSDVNPVEPDPIQVAEAYGMFDDRRDPFIRHGKELLERMNVVVAQIDERYR